MTKNEFIEELKTQLAGAVSGEVIRESVTYYSNYIEDQIRTGKSQEDIIQELGYPNMVAKSIIDANQNQDRRTGEERASAQKQKEQEKQNQKKGFHAETNANGKTSLKYGKFDFSAWYAKVLFAIFIVLAVGLVIALVLGIIALAWYVIIPVGIVLLIVWFLVKLFSNHSRDR